MKQSLLLLSLIIFTMILPAGAQDVKPGLCEKARTMIRSIQAFHYHPRELDDHFSEYVFDYTIENLDPFRMLFSKEDVEQLSVFKFTLDDELDTNSCLFITKCTDLYRDRLMHWDSVFGTYEIQDFSFTPSDSICFEKDMDFLEDSLLAIRWKKIFRLKMLEALYYADDSALQASKYEQMRDSILRNLIKTERCSMMQKIKDQQEFEKKMANIYLNAIASAFDPHTSYFDMSSKQMFETALSENERSFGLGVDKNRRDQVEVIWIAPGGPAWKTNQLEEGDILLQMETADEVHDFSCVDLYDIYALLMDEKIDSADFTFRKQSGRIFQIKLHKATLPNEGNRIYSYVLEGEKKMGYIFLPSFYVTETRIMNYTEGCSGDLAKEVIRLKREEDIEGLILDLRNNGGGSMMEAIKLAGIFVNFGAVGLQDVRGMEPLSLKDLERGMAYSGPLLIMLNGFSASASEFFSGAMQDHNRAVLVGSPTFGKASMQELVPLDAYKYNEGLMADENGEDFLNLTTGQFYRVTGESHQRTGVLPDIPLPDIFGEMETGESAYESSLPRQSIRKKTYYYPLDSLPLHYLKNKSAQRLSENFAFKGIEDLAGKIGSMNKGYSITLDTAGFASYQSMVNVFDSTIFSVDSSRFHLRNPAYLEGIKGFKDEESPIYQNFADEIMRDPYLHESYNILLDLINHQKP